MDTGEVVGGDYKGRGVGISFNGKKIWIVTKFSLKSDSRLFLDSNTVKKYELMSESADASGSTLKEMVWGTAAAINSAKNKVLVSIEFKDGKKSLIQCTKKMYQAIQISCFK